mgnify:CR=1 FL=1
MKKTIISAILVGTVVVLAAFLPSPIVGIVSIFVVSYLVCVYGYKKEI